METMPISVFKARCLKVLADVKRTGKPIVVTKFGEPVAEVVPPRVKEKKRKLGGMAHTILYMGDIVSPVIDLNDIEAYRETGEVLDLTKKPSRRRQRR